ncbi:MAG: hypothetical protein K0S33_3271 [Bacteroidetes bacterium]|jgi:hypothetical protein|nr:hypothetical protein [Bacteroidota bacterium]
MKKQITNIFKNKDHLLNEPEVKELLEYCEHLQDEMTELKFERDNSKETILLEIVSDILESCNAIQKEQEEHKRFGFEPADFEAAIDCLKSYIYKRCKDHKIYLK